MNLNIANISISKQSSIRFSNLGSRLFPKLFSKQFFIILALFLSPEVFAAGLFEVLPTDKSLEYLSIIFGGSVGAITLGGDANPMLSKMFERFNFIIVTVGVVILSYIGVVAAINTAREGESMGKKFTLWVPLRAILGMLLMIPSPGTGYSVVQMSVIWVVLNGIGAANTIWGVVLDQLGTGLKATGKVEFPMADSDLSPLAQQVLRASTCMQVLNNTPGIKLIQDYGRVKAYTTYEAVRKTPDQNPTQIDRDAIVKVGVESSPNPADRDLCGSFKVKTQIIKNDKYNSFNINSLDARLAVKVNALLAMFSVLSPAAEALSVVKPYNAPKDDEEPPMPNSGYIIQAINGYKGQMVNILTGVNLAAGGGSAISVGQGATIGAAGGAAFGGPIGAGVGAGAGALGAYAAETWEKTNDKVAIESGQVEAFKRLGWIHAGSYYYAMSKSATTTKIDQDATTIKPEPQTLIPEFGLSSKNALLDPPADGNPPKDWTTATKQLYIVLGNPENRIKLRDALDRTQTFYNGEKIDAVNSLPALGAGKVSSGNGFIDQILGGISDSIREPIIRRFQSAAHGHEDPLVGLGKFGWEIMLAGELGVFTAIIAALGLSSAFSGGSCMNPFAFSMNQLLLQVFIVVFSFLTLMWTFGATMGVYMPLIPYIIFTGTAVGWLLAVIEAVVAAPLIALAMVQPGGEELGALKQPLLILANLFLRPSLMIFGFVIAGSFLRALLTMVNFGFSRAVEESVLTTLFSIIPILGIYIGFVHALINQAFALIYELPNKAMRYMGHSDSGYEPTKAMEGAKKGADQGTQAGAGALKAAGGAAQGKLKGDLERRKALYDEERKKHPAKQPGGGFSESGSGSKEEKADVKEAGKIVGSSIGGGTAASLGEFRDSLEAGDAGGAGLAADAAARRARLEAMLAGGESGGAPEGEGVEGAGSASAQGGVPPAAADEGVSSGAPPGGELEAGDLGRLFGDEPYEGGPSTPSTSDTSGGAPATPSAAPTAGTEEEVPPPPPPPPSEEGGASSTTPSAAPSTTEEEAPPPYPTHLDETPPAPPSQPNMLPEDFVPPPPPEE